MKKFEPHYRLVRYGAATKIEKASRQQRMYTSFYISLDLWGREMGVGCAGGICWKRDCWLMGVIS